jgi:RNA polymerase-binding transcription factor DksA
MATKTKPIAKKAAAKSAQKKSPVAPAKAKHAPAAKPASAGKSAAAAKSAKSSHSMEKPSKKTALRTSILKRKAAAKPIAFSLDEVRAIAKTVTSKTNVPFPAKSAKGGPAKPATLERPAKPNHHKAASLSDILGFNPRRHSKPRHDLEEKDVPEKFHRYYKLLVELRNHLTGQLDEHTEQTLKRSAKDDAGDLSAYGQHMADAGTDTFDRDFALSMVANEQEVLSEIEAAIKRIKGGTYGVCEITGKAIAKDRLAAVPFTRYSAEAQKNLERNRHRSRTQAGLFAETGEETGKIAEEDGGGEE